MVSEERRSFLAGRNDSPTPESSVIIWPRSMKILVFPSNVYIHLDNIDFSVNDDLAIFQPFNQLHIEEYVYSREDLDYRSDLEHYLLQIAEHIYDRDFGGLLTLRTQPRREYLIEYLDQYCYSLYEFVWSRDNPHLDVICGLILESDRCDTLLHKLSTKFMYTLYYERRQIPIDSNYDNISEVVAKTMAMVNNNQMGILNWQLLLKWEQHFDDNHSEIEYCSDESTSEEYCQDGFKLVLPRGYAMIESPGYLSEHDMANPRQWIPFKLYSFEIATQNLI